MMRRSMVSMLTLLFTVTGPSVAWPADPANEKFIQEAIQGNLAEVRMGELAEEKGASQAVKDYGALLAADHRAANQSAEGVAQQLKVTPPDRPALKQNVTYQKLALLSGEHFDQEFISSMVKDHNEDISQYQAEAQRNGPAAAYAKESLPKLREHLVRAQDLERSTHIASTPPSSTRR